MSILNIVLSIGVLSVVQIASNLLLVGQFRAPVERAAPDVQHHVEPSSHAHGSVQESACDPKNYLVLIKAGAKAEYQSRREIWRSSSCPDIYDSHSMPYHFMLAQPAHKPIDPNGHTSGKRASEQEIADMRKLRDESMIHQDMVFLEMKDVYDDFNLKTMRILSWAVDRGMSASTSFVM